MAKEQEASTNARPKLATRAYRFVVATFIISVLSLQAVVSLGPLVGVQLGVRFWPVINYAMYSRSFEEGDTVYVYDIIEGVTADGDVFELPMESLDLELYHYRILAKDLRAGRTDALDFVRDKVPEDVTLTAVRIRTFPVAVTRDGPIEKESEVLATIPFGDPEAVEGDVEVAER